MNLNPLTPLVGTKSLVTEKRSSELFKTKGLESQPIAFISQVVATGMEMPMQHLSNLP